ncbi:MAG: hypothetical protein GXP31_11810 [Kiritimatiellaeota bacterium]|nr:hypothetical protein [Kiritimatiellota bacterium]
MNDIPRPEHPKPQFYRPDWLNLNGVWRFGFDFGASGLERGWASDPGALDREIVVPFCPESRLSGIGHTDFVSCVWYHRTFELPPNWEAKRVFLHFGAVDYDCRAWVNGREVGRHIGGSVSFAFEITGAVREGKNSITVCALDDVRSGRQPSGKQSPQFASHGCLYTRTTGIWQTAWLEAKPRIFFDWVQIVPDLDRGCFALVPRFDGTVAGLKFRAVASVDGSKVADAATSAANGLPLVLPLTCPQPWSPETPFLYDLRFELLEGTRAVDSVTSYAGLRRIEIDGNRVLLNHQPLFQRLVLDQGFYPDGIWTAPSDAELKGDIQRAMAVGFNGARLHQKVFEERFHYWADRLGYLTWGEFCDWGAGRDFRDAAMVRNLESEWTEVVLRDRNHPSIIAWTPTNETYASARADLPAHRRTLRELVNLTRAIDPTRPINDTSGYVHVETDLYTDHNYEQDPDLFRGHYEKLAPDARKGFHGHHAELSVPYNGQPFFVDEYGGTWWRAGAGAKAEAGGGWGYGEMPQTIEEVYRRIEKLTEVLTTHPHISGFCYTQLTDVEQEQNGIYTFDRKLKFDATRLRRAFGAPAAIEQDTGP